MARCVLIFLSELPIYENNLKKANGRPNFNKSESCKVWYSCKIITSPSCRYWVSYNSDLYEDWKKILLTLK